MHFPDDNFPCFISNILIWLASLITASESYPCSLMKVFVYCTVGSVSSTAFIVAPFCHFVSPWITHDPPMYQIIFVQLTARKSQIMYPKACFNHGNTWINFFKSSSVGAFTLVIRNDIASSISDSLPLFTSKSNLAMWWNIFTLPYWVLLLLHHPISWIDYLRLVLLYSLILPRCAIISP